jgi:hypothetical protein
MMRRFRVPQQWSAPAKWVAEAPREISAEVSSPTTTAFQVRVGPFMASHPW